MAEKKKPSRWMDLLKNEDWMSVWLGFLIIILILAGITIRVPTFRWTTDGQFQGIVGQMTPAVDSLVNSADEKKEADLLAAATTLKTAVETGDRKAIGDAAKALGDAAKKAQDSGLKARAGAITKELSGPAGQLTSKVFTWQNIWQSILIGLIFVVLAAIGNVVMGRPVGAFVVGFPAVYVLTWLSMFIAGNYTVNYYGLEFALWALLIGLFISNVLRLPAWMKEAVRTEYYIKTGLVMLGAAILFGEIIAAGAYGVIQAILVVLVVWYFCYWLAQKLRLDDEFAAVLATGVSICGVSAAIAACGAVQGDKKKLSYVVSMVLVIAVPMMVLMPLFAKWVGIPEMVAGAWIGGTIDTTGAVVAAGALYGDLAMKVATIVKFAQNVFIGLAAFILAFVWVFKKGAQAGERPSAMVIWDRFPKFVLGFLVTSIVFSFFLSSTLVSANLGTVNFLRVMWFALAFTCIGLETNFKELLALEGGRPAMVFIGAQGVNIVWTLILAFLLFGGIIFAAPMIR